MKAIFGARAVVVKTGGSCFNGLLDYQQNAKSLAQFQQQAGAPVAVVVSAAKGKTDQLIREARQDFPGDLWSQARTVAKGEDISALQLYEELVKLGVRAQLISAPEIDLLGWGGDDPFNGHLLGVDASKLERLVQQAPITIIPGYYAFDRTKRRRVLLGRGATDLIAVSLAGALGTECWFCKNGGAVYALDPDLSRTGRLPKTIPYLSYDQAHVFTTSGHGFLMPQSLLLAKQQGVKLVFMPSPAAVDAWKIGAIISHKPAEDGAFIGVLCQAYLNAVSCACVTVMQWGNIHLNGQLESLVMSCVDPFAIRVNGNQTKIYLEPSAVEPLVNALANQLNLLQPA